MQKIAGSNELVWLLIALIVSIAALTSVSFLADRLRASFTQNAHELIAADAIVRGDVPLHPLFEKKARELDLSLAKTTVFSTMMRVGQDSKLVSLKAITPTYPLRGQLILQHGTASLQPGQVWLDTELANSLHVEIGHQVSLGDQDFVIADFILKEPDRGAAFMNFSPRVMMREVDLPTTNLLGPGSRAVYRLMIAGQTADSLGTANQKIEAFSQWFGEEAQIKKMKGVSLEGIENGQPLLRKTIDQANRFLSLVALLTGMIAAVGIALATRRYVKKQVVATAVWRCFGASGSQILRQHVFFFLQIMLLSSVLGIAMGYALQEILILIMQGLLDQHLPPPTLWPVLWGFLIGGVLLLGFALPPLMALTAVSPLNVMRKESVGLRFQSGLAAFLGICSYAILLLGIAHNPKLSIIILGAFLGACIVFAVFSYGMAVRLGALIGNRLWPMKGLRFAFQRITGNPTWVSFQMSSLGIAMLALLLMMVMRLNVLESWQLSVPAQANNRFILNVLPDQKVAVQDYLQKHLTQTDYDAYPMIRGRLIHINDREIQGDDFQDDNTKRLVEREFNLSYSQNIPVKNVITSGQWFVGDDPNQVSMESGMMKSLKLQLGDYLTFDVAGQVYRVKITSVRKLDWNSMRVNFFAIMPAALLKDSPQSYIMAFHQEAQQRIDMEIVKLYSNITAINIQDSIAQVQGILGQLTFAIQVLFVFTLLAGFIVLMISLISVQEQRMKEVAILKTFGASQQFLLRIWLIELIFCGAMAGLLSGTFASLAGWYLANQQLEVEMAFPYWTIAVGGLMGVVINGAASIFLKARTFSTSPSMLLKN